MMDSGGQIFLVDAGEPLEPSEVRLRQLKSPLTSTLAFGRAKHKAVTRTWLQLLQ